MKELGKQLWSSTRQTIERYPIIIAASVIYLYYLLTSVNLFQHKGEKHSFLDYLMEFDSLFFLWLAAAALIQVQKFRKSYQQEAERRRTMERILDRQQIYTQILNEVNALLQDNVNNPLAIISVSTQEMRKKFEADNEVMRLLDRIDGSMQRIHFVIRDLQAYESQKVLESSEEILNAQSSIKS